MGYGSAGTPAWVDEEKIDEEKRKRKAAQDAEKIKELEEENAALKKRINQLEAELKKLRK
ncbi:MAG: Atg14 domain-containing protein [Candidatus Bathyarchaeota archaeon]|nr:Atg14 domain-containing protein [Candidatus Bathyarchaeota archaeon]